MKKYITPNMDIRIFSDLTETSEIISGVTQAEVPGLAGIDTNHKVQVNLDKMSAITKFTF